MLFIASVGYLQVTSGFRDFKQFMNLIATRIEIYERRKLMVENKTKTNHQSE